MEQPIWNFEQEPWVDERPDETSINLRAYFDRMPDDKMRQYSSDWSDERVVEWDGNFRDDGALMIACCERDVDVGEYRRVLEQEGAALLGVTLVAGLVDGRGFEQGIGQRAVRVMAVIAAHLPFRQRHVRSAVELDQHILVTLGARVVDR